jgi:HD superfamily phosphohydrolase
MNINDYLIDYLIDYKIISDTIHGSISLSRLAMLIIDTPEFQRLRYLKQLSTCYFVFPNAIHTRFEHSIGTYHIAKRTLYALRNKSRVSELDIIKNIPELQEYFKKNNITENYLTSFIIELVCIGALCHDLGHGPYSHLFDDYFLKNITINQKNKNYIHHEYRSCMLLKNIINKNSLLSKFIDDNLLQFIFNVINPNSDMHIDYIYQIVSNSVNSIDVDKFDYLTRDSKMLNINISFNYNRLIENCIVINNIISYPKKVDTDIINLFMMRHYLHKKVYSHKGVISSLFLINDLLKYMNEYLKFVDNIDNLDKFILLTDDYILNLGRLYSQNDTNLKHLLYKIDTHSLYPMIYSDYIEPNEEIDEKIKKLIDEDKNILYYENTIGFISGKKNNPLENVILYKTKDPYSNLENLLESDSNKLLPQKYQEKLIMLFRKNNINDNINDNISEIKNKRIKLK